jgi:hypothetical protein
MAILINEPQLIYRALAVHSNFQPETYEDIDSQNRIIKEEVTSRPRVYESQPVLLGAPIRYAKLNGYREFGEYVVKIEIISESVLGNLFGKLANRMNGQTKLEDMGRSEDGERFYLVVDNVPHIALLKIRDSTERGAFGNPNLLLGDRGNDLHQIWLGSFGAIPQKFGTEEEFEQQMALLERVVNAYTECIYDLAQSNGDKVVRPSFNISLRNI